MTTRLKRKRDKTSHASGEISNDGGKLVSDDNTVPLHATTSKEDPVEVDSSDEEDIRNTVGNIPMDWFKDYNHIGYDLLGRRILKPEAGDEIDEFIEKNDNPDYWRTVVDRSTGQKVILSDEDIALANSLVKGKYSNPSYNPYEPWIDFFTNETMVHPVTNQPEHKRSFIPSKWEKWKVGQLVAAMKMGRIKLRTEKPKDEEPKFYDLWANSEQSEVGRHYRHHIPAPPKPAPGHAESYNPPPEYLFTKEEEKAWKEKEPEDRRIDFVPQQYSSLRVVPSYPRYVNELFERCLDLYLCPRQRKMRVNVNPEDLIPKLPKPKDLKPFPATLSLVYRGHTDVVRCLSVDPTGQWLASGSQDCCLRLWEVSTGRCMRILKFKFPVKDVAWNPNSSYSTVAAAVGSDVVVLNSLLGDRLVVSKTDDLIQSSESLSTGASEEKKLVAVEWNTVSDKGEQQLGQRLRISHAKTVNQVVWHRQGDYLAAVTDGASAATTVVIHRLSKRQSQQPFSRLKGEVQCVQFHPTAPHFFVATKIAVRKYNLLKQELTKKLFTNCRWVSSIAVHPEGDHVLIGSYDRKLSWFDLDLSNKPYQTLKNHDKAIRQVCYHSRYPLFASSSADGSVIIYHGRVYDDLTQNPLIVPVKILRCHSSTDRNDIGVLDCEFHPTQPWILTCGVDNTLKLFT